MVEKRNEGLLVRAEPLQWAQEISQRMVDVVRVEDSVLLLEVDPQWAEAIYTVRVKVAQKRVQEPKTEKPTKRPISSRPDSLPEEPEPRQPGKPPDLPD